MKNINEYLSISINKKHLIEDPYTFPRIPKCSSIESFFKYHNFYRFSYEDILKRGGLSEMRKIAQISDKPIYIINNNFRLDYTNIDSEILKGVSWIRFCKNGPINNNNPKLFLYVSSTGNEKELLNTLKTIGSEFIGYNINTSEEYESYQEFRNLVNNLYDWSKI